MQAISVIAKVSISIDLRNELRGDFFRCYSMTYKKDVGGATLWRSTHTYT